MRGLVASDEEPLGMISFNKWVAENGHVLGHRYNNDLKERKYRLPEGTSP